MSTEETKPTTTIETPAAPAVESTPAPLTESAMTPADAEAPAAPETKKEETPVEAAATETPAPAAEKEEEKKPAEPIYSGALNYQAKHTGLEGTIKAAFQGPKKRYFWFGEDAPITTQNLNNYLRGEQPKTAHPAAAWSNKTGKGLLYFVKHADEKSNPAGVLLLADATDVVGTQGFNEFTFKLDGVKHVFGTGNAKEREGWVAALNKTIEEAKAMKEEVQNSQEYKDAMSHLSKPATAGLAGAGAAKSATPKESTDKVSTDGAADTKPEEEKKEKKASKTRSASRGKRASIFGAFGKKDETTEEKKEEKKEEKAEPEKEEAAAVAPIAAAETTAPATTESRPTEETPAAPAATETPVAERRKSESKPEDAKDELAKSASKAGKRNSLFGGFFDKVRSPTTEKKESEVTPAVPPKDENKDKELPAAPTEAPATTEPAPVTEATPAIVPVTEEKKEEKAEEKKPEGERKQSFFGKLKERADKTRSTSGEKPKETAKEPAKEETPATTTTEPTPATDATPAAIPAATEAKQEEVSAAEEPKTNGVSTDKPAEKKEEKKDSKPTEGRRPSFFSNKKDKPATDGEQKEGPAQKFGSIFRNPSKLIKGQKEGKKGNAPSKVNEETKVSDEAPKIEEPSKDDSRPLSESTADAGQPQNSIGDVVPEAVQVGQPPAATPAVSATA